jgi:hypothetical protein
VKSGTDQHEMKIIKNWLDECGDNFKIYNDIFD